MNKELRMGIKVEGEHKGTIAYIKKFVKKHGRFPDTKKIQASIAKEHIEEDPKYYTKLKKYKL